MRKGVKSNYFNYYIFFYRIKIKTTRYIVIQSA
jgi:hypothetical protein